MIRLLFFMVVQVCSVMVVAVAIAADPAYPNKPIRVIVPIAAGGQTDVIARLLAQRLSETFKQPLVVENRTGAGGSVGTEIAVKANPDGYTILLVASTYAANAALHKLPYDPVKDVTPIIFLGETGFVISVHPTVPVKSIKELIAYEKNNPGKLIYGSGGAGSTTHLATELFNQMAGTRMLHVPYKGSGAMMTDLLGGQVDFSFPTTAAALTYISSGRLRALGIASAKRSQAYPDIPTISEAGVPGFSVMGWYGLIGPARIPKDMLSTLSLEIVKISKKIDVRTKLLNAGAEPVGNSSDDFLSFIAADYEKWNKVIKIANIKM